MCDARCWNTSTAGFRPRGSISTLMATIGLRRLRSSLPIVTVTSTGWRSGVLPHPPNSVGVTQPTLNPSGGHVEHLRVVGIDEAGQLGGDHVFSNGGVERRFEAVRVLRLGYLGTVLGSPLLLGTLAGAVTPAAFRVVERGIGPSQDRLGRVALFQLSHPERGGHFQSTQRRSHDSATQTVSPLHSVRQRSFWTDHNELFASVPGHQFPGVKLILQQMRDVLQDFIPDAVAVVVVDRLEVVDVEEDGTERHRPRVLGIGEHLGQVFLQLRTIGESGQRIAGSQPSAILQSDPHRGGSSWPGE